MGLFDIPAPLYTAIDSLIDFIPLYGRLLIWAGVTGVVSMLLYWLCSAQDTVEAAKQRAITARRAMAGYEGTEFDEMWPLAKESLAASGKHFLIVLLPAIISSLPALTLIIWVSGNFSYTLPQTGQRIQVQSTPAASLAALPRDLDGGYLIDWPAIDNPVAVNSLESETLFALPLAYTVPVVHQKLWWNSLIGNPNGYIPTGASVQEVSFTLPRIEDLHIGPGWIRTWEFSYFTLLIICSIAIKVAFRIH